MGAVRLAHHTAPTLRHRTRTEPRPGLSQLAAFAFKLRFMAVAPLVIMDRISYR
jgi:hypothetical protein